MTPRRMTKPATKKPKTKAMPYVFIPPASEAGQTLYRWLRELLEAHHQDVLMARFALAWHTGWTPDDDGRLTLGMCQKCSDLEREVFDTAGAYDFVILLNRHFFDDPLVTDAQRIALIDHELCHAAVKCNDEGALIVDDRGRVAYRIRKHDLEEFAEIASRHGCWKGDLEAFAKALATARGTAVWPGYQTLHDALLSVGAPVPLDTVYTWNETERLEAQVWARTFREAKGVPLETTCPTHVLSGMKSSQATQ